MKLKGSCQCGKISFSVESKTPYPYMYCYCSICRKLCGGLGACNIMGQKKTLRLKGSKYLKCYYATLREIGKASHKSTGERWFCRECGTHLYVADKDYPEGIWPNAGAIDTPLPVPPSWVHLMLKFKPKWVPVIGKGSRYPRYPSLSIEDWHKKHGLLKK